MRERLQDLVGVSIEPIISIVIPAFNAGNTISDSLDSIFSGHEIPLHIILVDDGSSDDTALRVSQHPQRSRIRYIYQENSGVSSARNRGLGEVQTPFVGFLDADDEYCEGMIPRCLDRLLSTGADLVIVDNYEITLREGLPSETRISRNGWLLEGSQASFCEIMRRGGIGGPHKAVFRSDTFKVVGAFDEQLPVYEDLDLWTRIALSDLTWTHIEDPLIKRFQRGPHTSLTTESEMRHMACRRRVLQKHFRHALTLCDSYRASYHDTIWDFGIRYISDHGHILGGIGLLLEAVLVGRSIQRPLAAMKKYLLPSTSD